MKHRIPIIALTLLMASCLRAETTTQPAPKVVGPSDCLRISVLNLLMDGLETVSERQVTKDGYIHLLLLPKKIKVEGLTENQVRDAVVKAYASAKVLSNPSVEVEFYRPAGGATLRALLESLATQPATQPGRTALKQYIKEIRNKALNNLPVGAKFFDNKNEARLYNKIASDMKSGRHKIVAHLILTEGQWKKEVWYSFLVRAFAGHSTPELVGKSKSVRRALRKLALGKDACTGRTVSLLAAVALIKTDPKLTKAILLREYATPKITGLDFSPLPPGTPSPPPAGPYLRKLGVIVPNEITYPGELELFLISDGGNIKGAPKGWENPDKVLKSHTGRKGGVALATAANRLNKKLREMLKKKQFAQLKILAAKPKEIRSSFDVSEALRKMGWECYIDAWKNPDPAPKSTNDPGPWADDEPTTQPATQPAVETPKKRFAQKRLRQKIPKVTFDKNKLADTIQFLRDVSNLNIVVNWKSLESAKIRKATPVSLNLLNPSMKDILEGMLENARNSAGGNVAHYIVDEEGVITIAMPKHLRLSCKITLPERPTKKSRQTYKTLMQTLPKIDLPGVKIVFVVQFLREILSARIVVDWKALKSAGIDMRTPINLHLSNVSAGKVLKKTFELTGGQAELSYIIDDEGVIQISTKKTATTTSAPAVDPKVMAILKRLEAAGEKYPNITANIDYKVDMLQTGDTESRTGKVYYQGPSEKESAKFRIHFDTLRQGKGPKIKDVVDYAFDGAWLTVRKERIKQMSRYQVARPGEKVNPLQLGKGPFPVPFGQKADAVIKHFRATTRPAKKTDPKNTDYIKLTTRRRYRREFSVVWLQMWIDRKTSLPVKIVAEDRSENQTTVIFKDTKTPKSFPKKTFDLPRPPAGWEYHVERFKGQVK